MKMKANLSHLYQQPVYKFLKDPLIRKYGTEFYNELEEVKKAL